MDDGTKVVGIGKDKHSKDPNKRLLYYIDNPYDIDAEQDENEYIRYNYKRFHREPEEFE